MSDRPRIGVSACLLGERVRYDAGHKRDAWLVDELGPRVEWVPVCPEVEAGLGTPREPIQVERRADGHVAVTTVTSRRDLTGTMREYTDRRVAELADADLDGYVFKAGSPSCGIDHVRGVFADALMRRMPDLPVVDERGLADPVTRQAFVERVFARKGVGFRPVAIVRVRAGARTGAIDRTATEEPLEVRLNGRAFAVIMRTPGADRELAAGFLLSERVIAGTDDLGTIEHCTSPAMHTRPQENIVNVTLMDGARVEQVMADRRQVTMNSSCGLCGRTTIESIVADVPAVDASWSTTAGVIASLPERLREAQAVFDETGGLHAAGLFTPDGRLVDMAEDVGRHNAVDKVIGRMLLRDALPLSQYVLCVSGRTSFEIVQKAAVAGIPVVAAVSAPSSLAVDLAKSLGVTLLGFVRNDTFNIYCHDHRVIG